MSKAISRTFRILITGVGSLGLAAAVVGQEAQTRQTEATGPGTVKKQQLKGEVVHVDGDNNTLIVKTSSGEQRLFNIAPGKKFTIDGQERTLTQLVPGTALTADVTVTETPVVQRTTNVAHGKVFWASPTSVILTLDNGLNKQYAVKPDHQFEVEGKKVKATELQKGMELTGTRVIEEPTTMITREAVVTGTAPK